jgi:hypothetical protein
MKAVLKRASAMSPNFLIVGAAKSGTTSLYNYLIQNPDIYAETQGASVYDVRDLRESQRERSATPPKR